MRAPLWSHFGAYALALALALPLAACGEVIGGPCSLDDPCSEGICNLSGAGEPVCIETAGDIDGDGLPNSRDFCNQAAGGEFDEDGDLRGDACDPCPVSRPPASPDRDTDGVDSPCDPDPTIDGNKIILFDGFNSGAVPTGWRAENGTWTVRGGEATFAPTDANLDASLTAPIALPTRHLAVLSSYRVDSLTPGASESLAGVASTERIPAGTSKVTCASQRIGGADALLVVSNTGRMDRAFPSLFDPASLYRIVQLIDNAQGACAVLANMQEGAVATTTPGGAPTEAGLVARAANVRFQYLLLVQRPN